MLQEKEHELFKRKGNDLYCNYSIGITEALCGFHFTLKHLDGRDLVIRHPAGQVIKPGTVKTVPHEGMPIYRNPFEKGNLHIVFEVSFPPDKFVDEKKLQVRAQ